MNKIDTHNLFDREKNYLDIVQKIKAPLGRIHFHHTHWFANCKNKIDYPFPLDSVLGQAKLIPMDAYVSPELRKPLDKTPPPPGKVHYAAMIPFYFPTDSSGPDKLKMLLELIKEQAFDPTQNMQKLDLSRLRVVILVNRPKTLIPEETQNFIDSLQKIQDIQGLTFRIMAAHWTLALKSSFKVSRMDRMSAEETRKYVRIIAPSSLGEFDRRLRMLYAAAVPYVCLREALLKSSFILDCINNNPAKSPLYGVSWDADTVALNHGQKSFLSLLDAHIRNLNPDLISLGYNLPDTAPPLAKLAARIDMAIREVTNGEGLGVYFPEPSTAFRLTSKQTYVYEKKNRTIEGRRLIQAGIKNGELRSEHLIFKSEPSLVTAMPDRMFTKTIKNIKILKPSLLTQKTTFQALRGFPQSHLDPHQWAENVYIALPENKSKQMTDITTPLMTIFKSCDLVDRVYLQLTSSKTIDEVKKSLLSQKQLNLIKLQKTPRPLLTPEETGILEAQNLLYEKSKRELQSFEIDSDTITKVLHASAKASNRAIDVFLESFT